METIWIIGAGKFGQHALKGLMKKSDATHFVVVDPQELDISLAIYETTPHTLEYIPEDGIRFLTENLKPDAANTPSWIIPALPRHLAALWCQSVLTPGRLSSIEIPVEIDPMLPNPMRGKSGDLYVSHADFLCPSNCNEPDDYCTVTRKPRKPDMFRILGTLALTGFRSIVIQSHQLGPGIGGYRPAALFQLLDQIKNHALADTTISESFDMSLADNSFKIKTGEGQLLVSTACRCHGVITGFTQRQGR